MNIDRDGDSANWLAIMSKTKKTEKLKKTKKVLSPKVEEIKQLALDAMDEYNKNHGQDGHFISGSGGGVTTAKMTVGDTTYKAKRTLYTTGPTAGSTKSVEWSMRKKGWTADKPLKSGEIPSVVLTSIFKSPTKKKVV